MVGAQPAQFAFAGVDLLVELVDQAQARLDVSLPWLGKLEPFEQSASGDAEKLGDRTGLSVCEQKRVDAVLQARAVADEVKPPASALALPAFYARYSSASALPA